MIKINNNYYAKSTIKKVTEIISTEENCIHYLQFSVYINLGDGIISEEVVIFDNNTGEGRKGINTYFSGLMLQLRS